MIKELKDLAKSIKRNQNFSLLDMHKDTYMRSIQGNDYEI